MNKKFYVPFETAKMLKKAGYQQSGSDMYYNHNGELLTRTELEAGYNEEYPIMITYYYASPAYCEVLDWLEKKGYPIESACLRDFGGNDIMWVCGCSIHVSRIYQTREEALNDVILDVLKIL